MLATSIVWARVCEFGLCEEPCGIDADCAGGEVCDANGHCGGVSRCNASTDCGAGQVCNDDGICADGCAITGCDGNQSVMPKPMNAMSQRCAMRTSIVSEAHLRSGACGEACVENIGLGHGFVALMVAVMRASLPGGQIAIRAESVPTMNVA